MALVHAAIGIGEALITGLVLRFLLFVRPDLVEAEQPGVSSSSAGGGGEGLPSAAWRWSLAVSVFLAPFASEFDDGLEWVGGKLGFLKEERPILPAPIPDYQFPLPGQRYVRVATAMAGAVGTLIVFGVGFGLARVFSRSSPTTAESEFNTSHDAESPVKED